MNFIKKIVDEKTDELTHLQFQKFSRGEFTNRALIKAKQSKGKFTINTSAEFANDLVRSLAKKLGGTKTNFTGVIVSTNDLTGELNFKSKSQFQGVKKYFIEGEMSGEEIIKLLDKFPKAFFALSFSAGDSQLKVKPKAPTSGKPKSAKEGDDKIKADFCKLTTMDKDLGHSFVFEKPEFQEAEIVHTFKITEIIMPKGETDFAKIREMAKRKGTIVRKTKIDGKEIIKEIGFEA
jgi:hypothetical protein